MAATLSPKGHPDPPRPPPGQTRIRYRKAYWISIGISAVVHITGIIFYSSLLSEIPSGVLPVGGRTEALLDGGMELVNLRELPEEEVMEILPPDEPEPEPELPETPSILPQPGVVVDPGAEEERLPGRSAAEVLRPQEDGDLRIWAPPNPLLNRLSEEEIIRLQILSVLESMADSAAMAEELARRAMDWTYADEEGRKWGVSPGKIHLGDLTIPMPFSFGLSAADRQRVWEWDQIEGSAARGSVMNSWRDRDAAIRARMNAERKPDTTSVRR